MSYILDALKKSESERQRQSGPALFEVKLAPPRHRFAIWAVPLGALLAVNLLVIGWMLSRGAGSRTTPSPAQTSAAATAPAITPAVTPAVAAAAGATDLPRPAPAPATPAPSVPSPVSPMTRFGAMPSGAPPSQTAAGGMPSGETTASAGAGSAPPAGEASPDDAHQSPETSGEPGVSPDDLAPAVEPRRASTDASALRPAQPGSDESARHPTQPAPGVIRSTSSGLPTYQDAAASPGAGIPQLRLDFHVYSTEASERFVFVNMQLLHEGDSLPSGVHVEHITPDGAILSYRGREFVLQKPLGRASGG